MTDINVVIRENVIEAEMQSIVINANIQNDNINVALTEKQEYVFEVTEQVMNIEVGTGLFPSGGDMLKNTYDTNFNGLVDTCEYVDGGTF